MRRQVSRSYDVLYDAPEMAGDPKKVPIYLRNKRAWFVIDKEGVIRFTQINKPRDFQPPNDDILKVLGELS